MATQAELKAAKLYLNKVIASNNPVAAVKALKKYGYQTQFDVLPADQIEKALLEMLYADPAKYYAVVREVPYRQDITNWTTSPETKQKLANIYKQLGLGGSNASSKLNLNIGDIWNSITGALGGTTTNNPDVVTNVVEPAVSAGLIIIIAVSGIGAIVLLYLLASKKINTGGNSLKWVMAAIAVIIVGVILYAIFARKSTTTHSGGGGTSQGGLGNFVSGLFGGAGTWLGNIFGPKGGSGGTKYCDCSREGYAADGTADNNCKPGGLFYDSEC